MGQKEEEKEENISCVILTFIFIFKREINENNRITNVRTEKNTTESNFISRKRRYERIRYEQI